MIAMRDGEYLAMRVHVKCTGATKNYGKGIFYVTTERVAYESEKRGLCLERPVFLFPGASMEDFHKASSENDEETVNNMLGISDFMEDGKHGFIMYWYENGKPRAFNAEIQKHAGKRPTYHDVYWRIQEVAFHTERHYYDGWRPYVNEGDNIIQKDGQKVECTVVYPDKIPKYIDTVPLFNIYHPKLGEKINSGEWRFLDASGFVHNEESIMLDNLTGETFEDQYQFEKANRMTDAYKGGNYEFETGMMTRQQVLERFQGFMLELKSMEDYCVDTARLAGKEIQRIRDDKDDLERVRDYESRVTEWIAENKPDWLTERLYKGMRHHGTIQTHFERLTMFSVILARVREIAREKINGFKFVDEFLMYVCVAFDALWSILQNGADISEVVPNIPEHKYINLSVMVSDNEIKEFRKKLTEPL